MPLVPVVPRIKYLDGVRGAAALVVVLMHLIPGMFGSWLPWLMTTVWLKPFFNGDLAVYVFFVLSGFALSARFIETGDMRIVQALALRRYIRLTVPIFAVCAASYALLVSGLMFHREADEALHTGFIGLLVRAQPSGTGLLSFALFDVYFAYRVEQSYLGVLWTMPVEFIGSFWLFCCLLVAPRNASRFVIYLAFGSLALTINMPIAAFFVGTGIAEVAMAARRFRGSNAAMLVGLLLVGATLGGAMLPSAFRAPPWLLLFAVPIVAAPAISASVARFFESRPLQYLGALSFPLYLSHLLVICSYSSWLVLVLNGRLGREAIAIVVVSTSLALIFLLARLLLPVEAAAIALARRFSDAMMAHEARAEAAP